MDKNDYKNTKKHNTMKKIILLVVLLSLAVSTPLNAQIKFEDYFMEKTMRFNIRLIYNVKTVVVAKL